MPLGNNVSKNIEELYADNKKSGKARGANGKARSRAQVIAIAMSAAHKSMPKNPPPHKILHPQMGVVPHNHEVYKK